MLHPRRSLPNAFTVDVEDYFQVQAFAGTIPPSTWEGFESRIEANTDKALELLAAHGVHGTFFVLGWEARRRPELVRRIAAGGHEVACHGYGHQLVYGIGPEAFREDIQAAKGLLEDITGQPVTGYRAPSYSITAKSLWSLDILTEAGFAYDSSIVPARHDFYGLPGAPRFPYRIVTAAGSLVEFPPSTMRLGIGRLRATVPVGGGGYLRLYPLALTRWGLGGINARERQPFSVYVHPWELDPGQPRLQGPLRSRFRHYVNQDRTIARLDALLRQFRFGTMRETLAALGPLPERTVANGILREAV